MYWICSNSSVICGLEISDMKFLTNEYVSKRSGNITETVTSSATEGKDRKGSSGKNFQYLTAFCLFSGITSKRLHQNDVYKRESMANEYKKRELYER